MFRIACNDPWFSYLKAGEKRVEGRKGHAKYKNLQPGQEIEFFCPETRDTFKARVLKVEPYKDIQAYLDAVGVEEALPGVKSKEEALGIYATWSSTEDISHLGFVAIWIKVT